MWPVIPALSDTFLAGGISARPTTPLRMFEREICGFTDTGRHAQLVQKHHLSLWKSLAEVVDDGWVVRAAAAAEINLVYAIFWPLARIASARAFAVTRVIVAMQSSGLCAFADHVFAKTLAPVITKGLTIGWFWGCHK